MSKGYHAEPGKKTTGFARRNKQVADGRKVKAWHAAAAAVNKLDEVQQRMLAMSLLEKQCAELANHVPAPWNLSTMADAEAVMTLAEEVNTALSLMRRLVTTMKRRQEVCRGGG